VQDNLLVRPGEAEAQRAARAAVPVMMVAHQRRRPSGVAMASNTRSAAAWMVSLRA
jgi:hypothetical protein